MGDYWLALWSSNSIQPNPGITFYLGIYALWYAGHGAFVWIRERLLCYGCLVAAQNLHSKMFDCIMHAPMSFFDTVPTGRIVNRFSKDQASIDSYLNNIFSDVSSFLFSIV